MKWLDSEFMSKANTLFDVNFIMYERPNALNSSSELSVLAIQDNRELQPRWFW